jgi:hypothetical protein
MYSFDGIWVIELPKGKKIADTNIKKVKFMVLLFLNLSQSRQAIIETAF